MCIWKYTTLLKGQLCEWNVKILEVIYIFFFLGRTKLLEVHYDFSIEKLSLCAKGTQSAKLCWLCWNYAFTPDIQTLCRVRHQETPRLCVVFSTFHKCCVWSHQASLHWRSQDNVLCFQDFFRFLSFFPRQNLLQNLGIITKWISLIGRHTPSLILHSWQTDVCLEFPTLV